MEERELTPGGATRDAQSQEGQQGQMMEKRKATVPINTALFKKLLNEKVAENKATERARRIVKYEPSKMIWSGCVTYYRRSTDKQDTTIESQQTACIRKAQELGLEIINEYSDEITGKSDLSDREGMSRMMTEIKAGQILIVYSISRIARQIEVFYGIMKMLKERGCRVICCHEKLDSLDPHMEVIWAVHAAFAQQEREAISSRTKAALQTMKKKGQAVGRPRWGYEIDPETKKLVPIPELYEMIQSIVKMRTEQKLSLQQIADILNEISFPTPAKKGPWERRMVSVILQKELGKEESKKHWKQPGLSKKRQNMEMELLKEDLDFIATEKALTKAPEPVDEESDDEESIDEEPDDELSSDEQEPTEPGPAEPGPAEPVAIENPESNLQTKSPIVLRTMLMKRRAELGLSEEEIRELSKQDMVEILSCI
jgi:DNA invertase Pin-like site-specific DNA recombinase